MKKKYMEHHTLGRWVVWPIDPAYYIEDCRILNSGCGSPDFSNDQQCDDENNNEECNFDGGACCNNNVAGKVIYPEWIFTYLFLDRLDRQYKKLSLYIQIPNIYMGSGFEFGP